MGGAGLDEGTIAHRADKKLAGLRRPSILRRHSCGECCKLGDNWFFVVVHPQDPHVCSLFCQVVPYACQVPKRKAGCRFNGKQRNELCLKLCICAGPAARVK